METQVAASPSLPPYACATGRGASRRRHRSRQRVAISDRDSPLDGARVCGISDRDSPLGGTFADGQPAVGPAWQRQFLLAGAWHDVKVAFAAFLRAAAQGRTHALLFVSPSEISTGTIVRDQWPLARNVFLFRDHGLLDRRQGLHRASQ